MKTILAEASRVPVAKQIEEIVLATPVVDIHTHLYDPTFKELLLWGIDDLLVYHYLVAESSGNQVGANAARKSTASIRYESLLSCAGWRR